MSRINYAVKGRPITIQPRCTPAEEARLTREAFLKDIISIDFKYEWKMKWIADDSVIDWAAVYDIFDFSVNQVINFSLPSEQQ